MVDEPTDVSSWVVASSWACIREDLICALLTGWMPMIGLPSSLPCHQGYQLVPWLWSGGYCWGIPLHFLPIPMTLFTILNVIMLPDDTLNCWNRDLILLACCSPCILCGHARDADVDPNWIHSSRPWWPVNENDQNTLANIPVCLAMGGQTGILANNYLYFIACDYFWPQKLIFLQNSSWLWHSYICPRFIGGCKCSKILCAAFF